MNIYSIISVISLVASGLVIWILYFKSRKYYKLTMATRLEVMLISDRMARRKIEEIENLKKGYSGIEALAVKHAQYDKMLKSLKEEIFFPLVTEYPQIMPDKIKYDKIKNN